MCLNEKYEKGRVFCGEVVHLCPLICSEAVNVKEKELECDGKGGGLLRQL